MKVLRKIIEIDEEKCNGCGECIPACAERAIQIINGKACIIKDMFCDGIGACMEECPNDALRIIERRADEFDEQAVEEHLTATEKFPIDKRDLSCTCTSQKNQSFVLLKSFFNAHKADDKKLQSSISHWPVKIRLVSANAPFFKGADLLVMADCASVTLPDLHRTFLKEKVTLIGCPKFDDVQEYINRFAEIFKQTNIKSILVVNMEVPCCYGLPMIVKKGMEISKKRIPIEKMIISTRGIMLK